jgi:hypothetical protein
MHAFDIKRTPVRKRTTSRMKTAQLRMPNHDLQQANEHDVYAVFSQPSLPFFNSAREISQIIHDVDENRVSFVSIWS